MRDAPSVERSNGENAQELARRIKAQEGIELGVIDIKENEANV
jgi:hypothetical protein